MSEIKQNVIGAKWRLAGNAIYSPWPQVAVGLQHKRLQDTLIPQFLGASDRENDTDYYISFTKIDLAAAAGYHLFWNLTLRRTRANQLGLLGFGTVTDDRFEWHPEVSAGILLRRDLAVGAEWRRKPDKIASAKEDDWMDVFIAYFPSKKVTVAAAYVDLGNVAIFDNQKGVFLSMSMALD